MLYSSRLIPNHNLNAQMIDYVEQLLAKHIETTDLREPPLDEQNKP